TLSKFTSDAQYACLEAIDSLMDCSQSSSLPSTSFI
ncbi:hypothetical protein EC890511_4858, partial [Escherichia coli 89.0511]